MITLFSLTAPNPAAVHPEAQEIGALFFFLIRHQRDAVLTNT